MFQQVADFKAESDALYRLLLPLEDADFEQLTDFKCWTFNDVLQHLHFWNIAADTSLKNERALSDWFAPVMDALQGGSMRDFERNWLEDLRGRALLEGWNEFCGDMSQRFGEADPKARVRWAGPDMSVRSSITARQMETWAHAQAIYDRLGVKRQNEDRIKNIAVLGVNTFAWTFRNRGMDISGTPPLVRLTAPSGEIWAWNEPGDGNLVEGDAAEFCQVVTQVRNIADTKLRVEGDTAKAWMAMAQCFAGPPEEPPLPGTRCRRQTSTD